MAPWFGALILIAAGAGVLVVAWQGWQRGELPAGSRGTRRYRPDRADQPAAFHFFLILYLCGGVALAVWGLLILIGAAPPLRLQ